MKHVKTILCASLLAAASMNSAVAAIAKDGAVGTPTYDNTHTVRSVNYLHAEFNATKTQNAIAITPLSVPPVDNDNQATVAKWTLTPDADTSYAVTDLLVDSQGTTDYAAIFGSDTFGDAATHKFYDANSKATVDLSVVKNAGVTVAPGTHSVTLTLTGYSA